MPAPFDPAAVVGGMHLPSTGLKAAVGAQIKAHLRQILVDAVHEQADHALAIAHGRQLWKDAFTKDFGAYFGNDRFASGNMDRLAETSYALLCKVWDQRYPGVKPKAYLDALSPISPPTEQEIEDAWELEIGSDDKFMRQTYEGSCRTRKGANLGMKFNG